jgi:hypothetical protein
MELQPSSFPSDCSKIAYLITLMSWRVLAWAMAVWEQQLAMYSSLEEFVAEVKKVFDTPLCRREDTRKLLQLRQGSLSVADYAVDFRTLASARFPYTVVPIRPSESSWNPEALFDMFLFNFLI